MSLPYFTRQITAGDLDCDGNRIVCGRQYDLRWLRPQFVQGGGFEEGVPDSLFQLTLTGGGTAEISSTLKYDGSYSLYVELEDAATMYLVSRVYVPIKRSRTYFADVAYRTTGGERIVFDLVIWYYNSSLQYIGADTQTINATNSTVWATTTVTLTPPSGSAYAVATISKTSVIRSYGYIDRIRLWPSLEQQRYIAPEDAGTGWTKDVPQFAALESGDDEIFEFTSYPHISSTDMQDDPVSRLEFDSAVNERIMRPEKYTRTLVFAYLHREVVEHLRLWHHKTRGQTFTFVDEWGDSHTVRWVGVWQPIKYQNPDLQGLTIVLVKDDPWL